MRSFSKLSSALSATAMTALIGTLALPGTALAGVERGNGYSSSYDKITVLHDEYGKEVLVKSDIGIGDLKTMQDTLRDQARQIEELKRSSGSSSSSNNSEISNLKRQISDQDREMDQLKRTVEELSRKVK